MRTRQAVKNASMSLLLQLVLALSGIIIPRFFIEVYGSEVNGLVSSITQFITYMGLVEAGIGAAGTVALYRPLALEDRTQVNRILSAAKSFYLRSGIIFAALAAALMLIYPFFVHQDIDDKGFIRTMVFVLSISGIIDYFYLGKYRVLLQADQRGYVISIIQIIGTVVMTGVCIFLIKIHVSALLVKGAAAVIYILRSLCVGAYVKLKYPHSDFNAEPDYESFDQRWAALLHQVVGMIVCNTDIILLTILLKKGALIEVSVYSVYNLVAYALSSLMTSIQTGLGSGFGDVISRGETETLKRSFSSYEFMFFILIFIAYTCMAVLLYPFILIYCQDFADHSIYPRISLVVLFTIAGLIQSLRLPGLTIICAAGHYRETRWRAVLEAVINLSVSIALIFPYGINGVLIGTCASYLYRTTDVIIYNASRFNKGTLRKTFVRIIRNGICAAVMIFAGVRLITPAVHTWSGWFIAALVFGLASLLVFMGVNAVFESDEIRNMRSMISAILGKR